MTSQQSRIFVGSISSYSVVVSNNTIIGTKEGLSSGIGMTQVANPKIMGNTISNADVGISLQDVTGAVIRDNTLTNAVAGVSTGRPGYGNLVTGNTINDAACGIYAPTTPVNEFYNVGIINCYATGIP